MDDSRNLSNVLLYLLLTILFCTIPYVLMAHQGIMGGNGLYVAALMWGPASAAIVTTWWKRLDWADLGFGWRDTRSCFASYLLPIAYAGIAYAIIWATGMGGFADPDKVQALAQRVGWTFTDRAAVVPLYILLVGTVGMIGAVAHALGEEIGWRGFMTPRLFARFGYTRAAIVTGVIWTAWHVPLILFSDYNSEAPRWFALLCFLVMIMNSTFIMIWFRLRSGSVWPAAIIHGSHNLFIQRIFTPLTGSRGSITAYAIDEFGFVLPIVTFIFAVILWLRRDTAIAAWEARQMRKGS